MVQFGCTESARQRLSTSLRVLHAGVAQLCGLSAVEWVVSSCTLLAGVLSTLLAALWQLLQPSSEQQAHLPDLHQAILNVTRDASRVADLLQVRTGQDIAVHVRHAHITQYPWSRQ